MADMLHPGDPIIYCLTKRSTLPGPRARDVYAEPSGDGYTYDVDKFWVVTQRLPNGKLLVRTRRGKVRTLDVTDPNLRRPSWWERLLYSSRFPRLEG